MFNGLPIPYAKETGKSLPSICFVLSFCRLCIWSVSGIGFVDSIVSQACDQLVTSMLG